MSTPWNVLRSLQKLLFLCINHSKQNRSSIRVYQISIVSLSVLQLLCFFLCQALGFLPHLLHDLLLKSQQGLHIHFQLFSHLRKQQLSSKGFKNWTQAGSSKMCASKETSKHKKNKTRKNEQLTNTYSRCASLTIPLKSRLLSSRPCRLSRAKSKHRDRRVSRALERPSCFTDGRTMEALAFWKLCSFTTLAFFGSVSLLFRGLGFEGVNKLHLFAKTLLQWTWNDGVVIRWMVYNLFIGHSYRDV